MKRIILNKEGIALSESSPLKKKVGKWLFGDNSDKRAGQGKLAASEKALNKMQKDLMAIDTSNPFADAQNAYAGLDNQFADLENVYEGAENVYEGKMKNAFEGQKNAFEGMKNQMEGMENAFEDLTVNTQQAEFEAKQNQQQQANIMAQMAGAAGGSGIAALAQSMANQGALQTAKAAATIGAQEAQNQKLAADAEQKISMKTADEASKIAMTQAQEQSRLDTQKNKADMEIQGKVLDADQALQQQRLGEASKLQMAEAKAQQDLDMAEAKGEMDVQELKGKGDMWSTEQEIGKQKTAMEVEMAKYSAAAAQAGQPKDRGVLGNLFSDERLKENIIKLGYSHNGIPVYKFNYKNDNRLYVGTIAQDLISAGREDAVTEENGYYKVNYNLIDINMKQLNSPSPLKQLGGGAPMRQEQQQKNANQGMMQAGMAILSENQKRKNWEELQEAAVASEPEAMQRRKLADRMLREKQRDLLGPKGLIEAPGITGVANYNVYSNILYKHIKKLQGELYKAIKEGDIEKENDINNKVATAKRVSERYREETQDFYRDHFTPDSYLSKGCSQQALSFATQLFCENPDANIVFAEKADVMRGQTDYYQNIVVEGAAYAACYDFDGDVVMINILEGNKASWWSSLDKAIEYLGFLKEITDGAREAQRSKSVIKPPLGRINFKIDELFGLNDGTATLKQDQIVLQFCWDERMLKDGSSFRRHLYEHPRIQDLNYGGFNFDKMEFNQPLGPGDENFWHDNIDEMDRLRLVDAICNQDNDFFDIKLLRSLVKEYYALRIENAWWKAMGYEEGRLEIMRLKQRELIKSRFKLAFAEAQKQEATDFLFDGRVYKTGMPEKSDQDMMKEETAKETAKKLNINFNRE